jgi:predicted PurR-regulated permease PerM
MNRKKILISIVLIFTILFLIFNTVYFHQSIQNNQENLLESGNKLSKLESQLETEQEKILILKNQIDDLIHTPKNPLYEEYKRRISEKIENNISSILKEKPLHGGQWFLTKIRFISPTLVTIEYEDGHYSFESQIRVIIPDETFKFEVVK